MTLEELEEQLKVAQNQVKILTQQINHKKKDNAPKCGSCIKPLWSDYHQCIFFIEITLKDETNHEVCMSCYHDFIKENKDNIKDVFTKEK